MDEDGVQVKEVTRKRSPNHLEEWYLTHSLPSWNGFCCWVFGAVDKFCSNGYIDGQETDRYLYNNA